MMKRRAWMILALACACCASGCALFSGPPAPGVNPGAPSANPPPGVPERPASPPATTFKPGDVLSLEVFQEPTMSGDFVVDADGRIRHPILGNIWVSGMSVLVAESLIERQLKDGILVNPKVKVSRKASVLTARITINGQVAKPNEYTFNTEEKMTLRSVIARAGGLTPLAAAHRAVVIRKVDGEETRKVVDLERILAGQLADLELQPDDEIHIPDIRF